MDRPISREENELRALGFTVGLYLLIFALKLAVYLMTGVMALLAEALHTLSDILVSGFLLFAAVVSRKEADEEHMYGHGRAQNVAALIAGTLFISLTSFRLYEDAIPQFLRPGALVHQNLPLAIGAIVVSMLFALAPLLGLLRQGQRGAAAQAQLVELFNDELGLLAALVGTLLIMAGYPIADPIAAVVVATIIAVNAFGLLRENASALLGRSPGRQFLTEVREAARSVPGVLDVHDLRAEYMGPDRVRAELHIQVPRGLLVEKAERISHEVLNRCHGLMGEGYCTVHVEAAGSEQREEGPGAKDGDASAAPLLASQPRSQVGIQERKL